MIGIIHWNKFYKTLHNFIFLRNIFPDLLVIIADVFLIPLARSKYTVGERIHVSWSYSESKSTKESTTKITENVLNRLVMSYYFHLQ